MYHLVCLYHRTQWPYICVPLYMTLGRKLNFCMIYFVRQEWRCFLSYLCMYVCVCVGEMHCFRGSLIVFSNIESETNDNNFNTENDARRCFLACMHLFVASHCGRNAIAYAGCGCATTRLQFNHRCPFCLIELSFSVLICESATCETQSIPISDLPKRYVDVPSKSHK